MPEETGKRLVPSLHSPGVTRAPDKRLRNSQGTNQTQQNTSKKGRTGVQRSCRGEAQLTTELRRVGTQGAGEAGSCRGMLSPPRFRQGAGAWRAAGVERRGLTGGKGPLTSRSPACSRASCRGRSRWSAGAPCRTRTGRTAHATGCR